MCDVQRYLLFVSIAICLCISLLTVSGLHVLSTSASPGSAMFLCVNIVTNCREWFAEPPENMAQKVKG